MKHWARRTVAAGIGLTLMGGALAAPAKAEPTPEPGDLCALPTQADEYQHGYAVAGMSVAGTSEGCLRSYELDSGLLDGEVDRAFTERADRPLLRTGSAMLDGLYAMALHEEDLLSVNSVSNDAYNDNQPMDCTADGTGCYITGKNWSYVWTRDTAYAVDLGLAAVDPVRARNSLQFKLSERRDGGDQQIIQDTGTGGSYPNSTDRVSWAIGATEVLPWLDDAKRAAFAEQSLDAISNTIEHDRGVVYNPTTGLYLGETSYLDWRQQTYPYWTATDVTQITTSQSLSTNTTHWIAIDAAAKLAEAAGRSEDAAKYRGWADDLAESIRTEFWLEDHQQFSHLLSNALNQSATERYDALATALVVLTGIADDDQAAAAIANYPQTPFGPSVIWPQQQEDERSYHNKGIWPFVTAYMMRAAAQVGNDQATATQIDSLIYSSAMFASNYENMNITTGDVDTALNSERQTWSVAGTLGIFQDVIFGMQASEEGLTVDPYLPAQVRREFFPTQSQISLNRVDFRGHSVDIVLDLPADDAAQGAYTVTGLTVDGVAHALGTPITADQLGEHSVVRVQLGEATPTVEGPRVVSTYNKDGDDWPEPYAGDEAVFGPRIPVITGVPTPDADHKTMTLSLDLQGEDVKSMDIIRDGVVVADDIEPAATWVDTDAAAQDRVSYCYSVRTTYASGNTSQDANPSCHWGTKFDRVHKLEAADFTVTGGGDPIYKEGVLSHYSDWGSGADDTISAEFTPEIAGRYLIQTDYALDGDIRSGVSSAIKRVVVTEGDAEVGGGIIAMPVTGGWHIEAGSTFASVDLKAGVTYTVTLKNDRGTANMSYFQANALYRDTRDSSRNLADVFRIKAMLKLATVDKMDVAIDEASHKEAEVGQDVTLKALVSSDSAITAEDVRGGVSVDWGDGSAAGSFADPAAEGEGFAVEGSHRYAEPGTYTVTVTARGTEGDSTATHTVVVRAKAELTLDPADADGQDSWYVTAPTATLAVPGAEADAATLQYRLDDQADWQAYTAPIAIPEGQHTVAYRSVGAQGREGVERTAPVKVDTVAPEAGGTVTLGETDAQVSLTATDATSGLDRIEYRLAEADEWTPFTAAFTAPRTAEAGTVSYRAFDKAGNVSAVGSLAIEALPVVPTGDFEVVKVVVDDSNLVPADAEFVVDYFINGSEAPAGSLKVKAGDTVAGPDGLAEGTKVAFEERTPAPVAKGTWGDAVIEPGEITIEADETSTVTVTNTLTHNLGTFSIAKKIEGADAAGQEFTFTYTPEGGKAETVTVKAGESWASAQLPEGTVVTVAESGNAELDGLRFAGVSYTGKGIEAGDKEAKLTIGNATTTVVTATNSYVDASAPAPQPSEPGTDHPGGGLPSAGVGGAAGIAVLLGLAVAVALVARKRRQQA